ncbi:MAG: dTDP-4-dehydrorhamnose reductase [Nitrosopumilus sp.]|nr:dTDP-4-dehydrorhamnose reductase [Nitrosopumilus sp.]MDH3385530.1 dTDP-4-dehydrorhamnose reductase [Nitrosopumilus sp.]
MKFLVTGSAGLVGQNVVRDLVKKNQEVFSVYHNDRPVDGTPINLDLTDLEKIKHTMQDIKPDIVIHLAAMTNVDLCETEQELAHTINVKSTETLAKQAAKSKAFFVYISTDYVFDGKEGMKKEDDIPNPLGYYGKTKLEGEMVLNNLASNWAIARTSTPFGLHPKKKSFPLWVKESLESKKEINVLTDQFTSPTYVPNLSKMIIEVATKQINGIIHLAGASRISRYELASMIAEKLNLDKKLLLKAKTEEMNWKAKRPKDSSLDVSKATEILDEKPQAIEQSIPLFLDEITN